MSEFPVRGEQAVTLCACCFAIRLGFAYRPSGNARHAEGIDYLKALEEELPRSIARTNVRAMLVGIDFMHPTG
jgi:hypothetical protein